MYDSPNYPTDPKAVANFVREAEYGTLVATGASGWPQVTIVPFVIDDLTIWVHCVQEDPTYKALTQTDRCTFFISDFLAFTPHDWVDTRNAARATLNFRAVAYECTAEVFTAPSTVAEVLRKTLDRYEPAKDYEPVEDSDFYGPRLRRLAAVRMQVVKVHAKFKVGPYGPPALKSHVADQLQKRSRPGDQRAAEVISRYALGEV